jgi:predicted transcriptional regulator
MKLIPFSAFNGRTGAEPLHNGNQELVLKVLQDNPYSDVGKLSKVTGLDIPAVRNCLRRLIDANKVVPQNHGPRHKHYSAVQSVPLLSKVW